MSYTTRFRVRWFTQVGELIIIPSGDDARLVAESLAGDDRTRAVSIECDGGEGACQYVALGSAGVVWDRDDHNPSTIDLVARVWEVEDAAEEVGIGDSPQFLLAEFAALAGDIFADTDRPRLLTAEEVDTEDDSIECWAVSLWDPADYDDDFDDYDEEE